MSKGRGDADPKPHELYQGNLIVFPDCLKLGSTIAVVESVDPNLYVDWANLT